MLRKRAAAALCSARPLVAAPAAQAAAPAGCFDRSAPSTYEESRIDTPALPGGVQVSSALVEAVGFTSYVERLCFNAGIVEDAFGPHLTASAPERADLIMTISQGIRGTMNIEQWAGAWRGGSPDNLHISALVYPADPLVLIDQAFAADRAQTIEQTMALVKAAGAAVSGS